MNIEVSLDFMGVDNDAVSFEPENPTRYKGDCKAGEFKRGAINRVIGSELRGIQPLFFYQFTGSLYKTKDKSTRWGELIFIDEKRQVCSILLKTISLDKFKAAVEDAVRYDGLKPHEMLLAAKMTPKSSDKGDYFAIEWEVSKADDQRVNIAEDFIQNGGGVGLYNIYTLKEYAVSNKLADSYDDVDEAALEKAAKRFGLIPSDEPEKIEAANE